MSLSTEQQIIQTLSASRRPLIVFRKHFSGDSIAAALAMCLLLKKHDITADIVCDGFSLPDSYQFLPGSNAIKGEIRSPRKLIISLAADKTNIDEFHYDIIDNQLKIYVTPKKGMYGPQDITASVSDWEYDLIITVDTPDLESLGNIFTENRDFFFDRPIINIDHAPNNEQYGQINYIDLTANSTTSLIYNLIAAWDESYFDSDMNTCLLCGIIDKTKSFKAGQINPKTLQMSSHLMEKDARREEIVKHLYYSRNLSTLKLWGLVLSGLTEHQDGRVVTAQISHENFAATNTTSAQLPDIVDELIASVPDVELIVLTYHKDEQYVGCIIRSLNAIDATYLARQHQPVGDRQQAQFAVKGQQIASVEQAILAEIDQLYRQRPDTAEINNF